MTEATFLLSGSIPEGKASDIPLGTRAPASGSDPWEGHEVQPVPEHNGYTVDWEGPLQIEGKLSFEGPARDELFVNFLMCYRWDGGSGLLVLDQSSTRNDGSWEISFGAEWESPGLVDSEGREIVYTGYCIQEIGYTTHPFPTRLVTPDSYITFRYGEV